MEDVRMLVQEEGRAARNLIAFHVAGPVTGKTLKHKPPSSPRLLNDIRMTKRSPIMVKAGSRVRSASTGRDKKSELQARYWAFLFGNLQRAVDEIYQTCESDESVSECKEVILVLENFTRDFHNLIEWFRLKWEYETTPPPDRPTSLAWEVRKSSPNKALTASKINRNNKAENPSPSLGIKPLNLCSDNNLTSKEGVPKRVLTPDDENILINQYGLSFGDVNLRDCLLQMGDNVSITSDMKSLKSDEARDEDNKENYPSIIVHDHIYLGEKIKSDVKSVDQFSQTDSLPQQNNVEILKPTNSSSTQTLKKIATLPTKSTGSIPAKPVVILPHLNVHKSAPVSSTRKVPLSPTNTAAPKVVVPGRNVAAVAFVPSKRPPVVTQNKANLSVNLKNITISGKLPNAQTTDKINKNREASNEFTTSDLKNSEISVSYTLQDTKKVYNISNKDNISNDRKSDGSVSICIDKKESNNHCVNIKTDSDKSLSNENVAERRESAQIEEMGLNDNITKEKNDETKSADCPQVLSGLQTIVKQQGNKVLSLVRNKTTPNIHRRVNEILLPPENPKSDSLKAPSSSAVMHLRSLTNAVRKQDSTNEKPMYYPKVYRSNTAIDIRPSKTGLKRNSTSVYSKIMPHNTQTSPFQRNMSLTSKTKLPTKNENAKGETSLRKKNSIDEDGWETVTGRNRWRFSQSSSNIKARSAPASARFCLPSPATSLPALVLTSNDFENDVRPAKKHKDRQNQEIAKANKAALKSSNSPRQSDVVEMETGTNVLSVTNKPARDVSVKKPKMFSHDRKKLPNIKMKQISTKGGDGHKNIETADNKMDKLMDVLSSEDERMNEEDLRKSMELYEEEKMLTKEIQDLEQAEIEMDTETDDGETDGETTAGMEEDDTNKRISALKASYEDVCHNLSWADQMDTLEKLEQLMASDTSTKGIPFSERLTTLEQLEELVARHPGRALELHQKLSSPSRRRPLPDTIQRDHARQASAKQKREQLLQDKSAKIRELLNKVEEVKMAQAQLIEERKQRLADKLKRADENRASHLRSIQRKAHDEEEKLREIAFINELEAQNKRHDFMALCQEQQDRLQGILDERQRRLEEKAAKEAAVEERRRILEAERQEKLEKMQERRRKREERIGREQQEKEKERLELAREKARDREERLQALQAAQLATVEELQKKIQQKQSESARRHEENIEHIRQRALESGVLRASDEDAPRLTPYPTQKLCRVCNLLIESEVHLLSHLRGKVHQEAVKGKDDSEAVIFDAPPDILNQKLKQDRDRQKALKKRCKKIRARMAQRAEEYQASVSTEKKNLESPNKGRLLKCLKDVEKLQTSQGVGQWSNNAITLLERNLGEIVRILEKQNTLDQNLFRYLNGFTCLSTILNLALDIPKNMSPYLPPKCFVTACTVYSLACTHHLDNSTFVICTNKIALILDLLVNRLNTIIADDYRCLSMDKSSSSLPVDPVAGALMKLFSVILSHSQGDTSETVPDISTRLQDIVSYTVSVGVVDKLAVYCRRVQEPVDNPSAAQLLLSAIQLLTTLCQTKCGLASTQLPATLRVTELVGAVSMLYCTLLGPPRDEASLPPHTVAVTAATLDLLTAVAQFDLNIFQSVLGEEGMSLQLRHIASFLLWYCSRTDERPLLHQVIQVVGYFAVNHYDNQMMLQSGHMPTVLQQLCNLPFEYFSDPTLSSQLFPTLLACCHGNTENRAILEQELSYQLLEDFKNSEAALNNPLIKLMK